MTGLSTSPVCSYFYRDYKKDSSRRTLPEFSAAVRPEKWLVPKYNTRREKIPLQKTLLTDTEFLDEGPVGIDILFLQIVKKTPSLTNKLQQALPGMMIFDMGLEMLGEILNTIRKKRDLH
jgi:hypothetical protein